jgi:hypothetical protein
VIDPDDIGLVNCWWCGAELVGEDTARRLDRLDLAGATGQLPPKAKLPRCVRNRLGRPKCPHECGERPTPPRWVGRLPWEDRPPTGRHQGGFTPLRYEDLDNYISASEGE